MTKVMLFNRDAVCNNTLNCFTWQLAEAFHKRGIQTTVFDINHPEDICNMM